MHTVDRYHMPPAPPGAGQGYSSTDSAQQLNTGWCLFFKRLRVFGVWYLLPSVQRLQQGGSEVVALLTNGFGGFLPKNNARVCDLPAV